VGEDHDMRAALCVLLDGRPVVVD
jgi:hypothetical protein